MVLKEDQYVDRSSLLNILAPDLYSSNETIGWTFDFFDEPKWALTAKIIFANDKDDIVHLKAFLTSQTCGESVVQKDTHWRIAKKTC